MVALLCAWLCVSLFQSSWAFLSHPIVDIRRHLTKRQSQVRPYTGVEIDPAAEVGRWYNEKLKLDVVVAPSKVAKGLGLFIALGKDAQGEVQHIPAGSTLCSYADGSFVSRGQGDKTLMFFLDDVYETW